jgi:hypothetical protein
MVGNAKGQAAAAFISIRANFNEEGWKRYQSAVPTPVGLGDIIGRIVTGVTTTTNTRAQGMIPYTLALARDDISRLADNTHAYWTWEAQQAGSSSMSEYQMYIDDAILLRDVFLKHAVANPLPTTTTNVVISSGINTTMSKSSGHVLATGGGGGTTGSTKLLLKAGGSSSGVVPTVAVVKSKGVGSNNRGVPSSSGVGGSDVRDILQQLQSLAKHPSVIAYNIPSATIEKRLTKFYRYISFSFPYRPIVVILYYVTFRNIPILNPKSFPYILLIHLSSSYVSITKQRETFGEVLRRVREHYVISVFPPYPKIMTCGPFEKAVDPRAFPTYDQVENTTIH